jgi:hypothetical protein
MRHYPRLMRETPKVHPLKRAAAVSIGVEIHVQPGGVLGDYLGLTIDHFRRANNHIR